MGKYIVMLAMVLFFIGGSGVMAQDQVQMHVSMFKDVSSKGETYGISFDLSDDALKKVTRVYIQGPKGARIWVNNTLNLNDMLLSAVNLPIDEFNRWFPAGNYKIMLTPAVFGTLKVNMTHNFPSTPAILYPLEGSMDVPTNPVIAWMPVTGIINLHLQLKDDVGFIFGVNLPINATSYSVPANLLRVNTRYELSLAAKVADSYSNRLVSTSIISFTTLAQ